MISRWLSLVCAISVALAHGAWAGEELLCAVVYKGSGYLADRTDLFSVDPETGANRLIFSDENTEIVVLQHLYVFHFPVTGGGRVFAHAARRGGHVPFPGNDSLYELSTDGSNTFRRIAPVSGSESLGDIFANSSGTRIGYINRINRKQYLFVHDIEAGTLIHQVDITDIFLDCFASAIGWVPDSEQLYFTLETGDDHVTSEDSRSRVGSYIMHESGANLTKLSALPPREGYHPPDTARIIGVPASGEYVFETMQQKLTPGREPRTLFAVVKRGTGFPEVEDMSFTPAAGLYSGIRVSYQLSPSGKYLAAAALPISSSAVSCDILLKDLHTGRERKIFSRATKGLQGPFVGLVGWAQGNE